MMQLRPGIQDTLRINVFEITENDVNSNGHLKNEFSMYYPQEFNNIVNGTKYSDGNYTYEAKIEFYFESRNNYNNYKASTIDAWVKFTSLLVFFFMGWNILRAIVRIKFYREFN